jgi:hypothetical protein
MDEKDKEPLKLQFDKRLRLEFHGDDIGEVSALTRSRDSDEALGRGFWVLSAYTLRAPTGAGLWGGLTTGPKAHVLQQQER